MLVSPKVESSLRMSPILADGELSASIRRAMRGGLVDHSVRSSRVQAASRQASVSPARSGFSSASPKGSASGRVQASFVSVTVVGVRRQAVEGRAGAARELLEPVERAGRLERLGVELERAERGVAAGAAAGVLLQRGGMRRAVGAEEEAAAARGRGGDEGATMLLALEHRQAVVVRPQAAAEERVAVVEQVVRGDRRRRRRPGARRRTARPPSS